jgi:TIR domain
LSKDGSHIFICFSSKDEAVARDVVEFLEEAGLKCWISSRDVPPGHNYQETIVHALEAARGIVFLFSESSSKSGEIKKELSIGGSINTPVFPLRLSPITPTGALRYELATRQWIDIFPDQERALGKLVDTINRVLDAPAGEVEGTGVIAEPPVRTTASTPVAVMPAPAKKRSRAPTRKPLIASDSQEFEAIRALLAHHIGPIARVLLQKAATEARTPDDFCERLAAHVGVPSARAAFVQAVRARLAAGS